VTAAVLKEQQEAVLEAGADCIIKKPVSKGELLSTLMRYLPKTATTTIKKQETKTGTTLPSKTVTTPNAAQLTELAGILQKEYLIRWQEVSRTLMIEDVRQYSNDILELAHHYPVPVFEAWGAKLMNAIKGFDMERVTGTLTEFPALIEKIAEQGKKKNGNTTNTWETNETQHDKKH
ncbi:MAG: hypothetical protein GY757_30005, partial [bacterium]|nr:hypothetical protein [bacterium]